MFHGVIYGYRDPNTGNMRYVGQTENLVRRHKRHLLTNASLPVDRWLRSLPTVPEPELICEVMAFDRQTFLDEMANRETVAMFHHHTYVLSYPNEGGLNKTIPQSKDYENLGRIGGRIGGQRAVESGHLKRIEGIGGRQNAKSGQIAKARACVNQENVLRAATKRVGAKTGFGTSVEGRVKGGKSAGRKAKENSTGIFSLGMQAKGGYAGMHTRWHVWRDVINPSCSLCVVI